MSYVLGMLIVGSAKCYVETQGVLTIKLGFRRIMT